MPPVHFGRWTQESMAAIGRRHGFNLVDQQVNPRSPAIELYNSLPTG